MNVPRRPRIGWSAGCAAVALAAAAAHACPRCGVSNGDLDTKNLITNTSPAPATKPATAPASPTDAGDATRAAAGLDAPAARQFPLRVTLGLDVPSAYVYRGYLQADRGLIAQPFLTLYTAAVDRPGLKVEPYVNWANTFLDTSNGDIKHQHGSAQQSVTRTEQYLDPGHAGNTAPHFHTRTVTALEGADGKGWYESQLTLGVAVTRGDWFVDFKYHVCWFPDGSHDAIQEIGAKVSYDVTALLPNRTPDFSLRPYAFAMYELDDDNGDEDTYVEIGLEPQWRFAAFGQRFGLSTPVSVSLSPDGYFTDSTGGDAAFGTAAAALRATWMLPVDPKLGRWYLNASTTYYHFLSDSTEQSNGGDEGKWAASVGLGVSF
jgi:hypothetical protein